MSARAEPTPLPERQHARPDHDTLSTRIHFAADATENEAQFYRMSSETKELFMDSQQVSFKNKVNNLMGDSPQAIKEKEAKLNKIVGVVILINVVLIGLELDYGPGIDAPFKARAFWWTMEVLILLVFLLELFARVYWERRRWPRSPWNWFDLVIVLCGCFEAIVLPSLDASSGFTKSAFSLIRTIRLARLVRFVKLMKVFRGLYLAVTAFKVALLHIIHICFIMIGGVYVSAIIMTAFVGQNEELSTVEMGLADGDARFGTMGRSFYSLFELMTLEGWELTGRPLMSHNPLLGLFIICFIMIFSFGLLNMLLAMVVQMKVAQARQMAAIDNKAHVQEMVTAMSIIFQELDENGDGMLSRDELEHFSEHPRLKKCLKSLEMDLKDVSKLFSILEVNGSVLAKEFLEGCVRVRGAGDHNWERMALRADCNGLKAKVEALGSSFHHMQHVQQATVFKDVSASSLAEAQVVPLGECGDSETSTDSRLPPEPRLERSSSDLLFSNGPPRDAAASRAFPSRDGLASPSEAASASIMSTSNRSGGFQKADFLRGLTAAAAAGEETHRQILSRLEACEKKARNRRLQSPAESSTEEPLAVPGYPH